MKGEKFQVAVFSGAAFISGFFLTFLVFLASLAAGNSFPLIFYLLAFIAIGYAYFDVFRHKNERLYISNAATVSSVLVLLPFSGKTLIGVFSGVIDTLGSFLFDVSVSGDILNFDLVFATIFLSFNISVLALYQLRERFQSYRHIALLGIPLLIYAGLSLLAYAV